MMKKPRLVVRTTAALTLGAVLVVTGTSLASATTKPVHDVVPAGAKVIYFDSSAVSLGNGVTGTNATEITNPKVIAEVRNLINSLPVSNTSKMFCPDDLMIPAWVSFSNSAGSTPFARVEFQLGGCPFARVYQHSVGELPTLGGPRLGTVYAKIKSLFNAVN
jgi:hypothetical protein